MNTFLKLFGSWVIVADTNSSAQPNKPTTVHMADGTTKDVMLKSAVGTFKGNTFYDFVSDREPSRNGFRRVRRISDYARELDQ